MTTTNIVFLIDIQNGFAKGGLTAEQGGSLYVLHGETSAAPAADIIEKAQNTIFVLSMDFHPDDIISDMTNHPGIMALRDKQAKEQGIDVSALPFTDIYLRKGDDGIYRSAGVIVGDKVLAVETDNRGYVSGVSEQEATILPTDLKQTLWTKHCVQNTHSALFVKEIMDVLPAELAEKIYAHDMSPTLYAEGKNGNIFYVVRKGMRRDVDSNAIALENNQESFTSAIEVFDEIADRLQTKGVTHVKQSLGGLAGNICAELSQNNVHSYFVPRLAEKGISTELSFITDISPNIPISIPGGAFPDAEHSVSRMARYGSKQITADDVIRSTLSTKTTANPTPTAQPQG